MPLAFTVTAVIPASAKDIYEAWLDGARHAQMTGTKSGKASVEVGGAHEVWDGYISGHNLKLVPGRRIVQSWRTTEFEPGDPDSQIDITLAKTARGTRLTLAHTNVPDGHAGYKTGWATHYFTPMKAYFIAQAKTSAAAKPKAKSKAKPKAAAKTKAASGKKVAAKPATKRTTAKKKAKR